jgi:hypothetical protein
MQSKMLKVVRLGLLLIACSALASCDPPAIYGSVGFSNYSGGYYGGGMRTGVTIGGRIY